MSRLHCAGAAAIIAFGLAASAQGDDAEDREAALLFNTASRFYRQKNWEDAANSFGEFLRKFAAHKDAPEARFAAGYCLNKVGKHAAAVELLRLSIRDEGTAWSADAHFYLGRSLEALAGDAKGDAKERSQRLVAAAETYGKAAALYEKASRAEAAPKAGPAEASADDRAAREKSRDFRVLALGAQGEALYQADKFAEADAALAPLVKEREALGVSAYYHRGIYVLGLARHAQAKAAGASYSNACAALAIAADPAYEKESLWEESAYLLARLTHQDGDLAGAVERYAPVARKGGGRAPEAAYYRGLALYEIGKPETLAQAREELARFQRDYPRSDFAPRARFYEALSAFDLKDYAGCEPLFGEVAQASPTDLAGRALLRQGQALLLKAEPNASAAAEVLGKAVETLDREVSSSSPDTAKEGSLPQRLAEALYWRGEALLALDGKLVDAAQSFGQVHSRFAKESPELAEKSLYQMARALYLGGQYAQAAEASDLYRKAYAPPRGVFTAESLLLSAECAFHAPVGALPDAARREAPRFYKEAGAQLKDPVEARRSRYMAGVAHYFLGEYAAAAEALQAVHAEVEKDSTVEAALPELSFYLADALAQEPRREPATPEDRERWKRAVALYNHYLDRSKDGSHVPSAIVNLGLCLEWLGDNEGARATFERFLTHFPNHALASQVRFELANTRLVLGQLEAAALAYASAADSAASSSAVLSARALYQKAMLERKLGKSKDAAQTLSGLLDKFGSTVQSDEQGARILRDARYQRAIALLEAGDGDHAREELSGFLTGNAGSPQETEARNQLARSLLDAGKPTEALAALEPTLSAPASREGRDQALYLAAWCHGSIAASKEGPAAASARDEMESAYRKLIGEHPSSSLAVDAMLELGQTLFNRKAYAESQKWLLQVRESLEAQTVPLEPAAQTRSKELLERALFGLAFIAFEKEEFAEAASLFDRVAENAASPLAPRSAFQAGRAYMKLSDWAHAVERFQRVADEFQARLAAENGDRFHEEGLLRLGESQHQLRKYSEALAAFDRQLKEHPEGELRHEARFGRGFALQMSGDFDGAVDAYRAVVAGTRQPVAARAQYHVGECRVEQKRHRDAAREFNTTVANFDFDGEYREWVRRSLLAAGIAFQTAGDTKAASTQFRELTERFPDTDEGKAAGERLRTLGTQ